MPFFPKRVPVVTTVLACAMAMPAFAADRGAAAVAGSRADFSAVQARRSALLAAPRTTAAPGRAVTAADASTGVTSSSYRAYPPSCFSDTLPTSSNLIQPLPVTTSGPVYSKTVTLYEKDGTADSTEDVTISIWRVACSSSGDAAYNPVGGYVGATLMRIQRQAQYDRDWQIYPWFPDIRIAQGNIVFDNAGYTDYVRVATEPNTIFADTTVDSAVINSTTYVLENYASPTLGFFYFNNAFAIRFDNGYQNGQTTISVPDYNPTRQTYPAAYQPIAINGYLSGSWYAGSGKGGEGMLTQIYDGDGVNRTFFATWYTFDTLGLPFWLVAQASFPIGSTKLTAVPVLYATGGGFAGNYTAIMRNQWGTMDVSFSDCQHITVDYNGTSSAIQGGPSGSGTLNWVRLGNINSLNCQ
ncbi:MAG: hypothetical protein QM741_06035 [Rudaea sp.]|uniref:hypothetical protein n=1 Tax=Rudaea sp. TaxID=2136325 RepID=UPI0039E27345